MDPKAPSERELQLSNRVVMLWATMGDAYLRDKQLEPAEKYLKASWAWTRSPIVADRLGQLYEQQGRKTDAIKFYSAAVSKYTSFPYDKSQPRLDALMAGDKDAQATIEQNMHTTLREQPVLLPVPKEQISPGQANYRLIFAPQDKVDAHFVYGTNGMDRLQPLVAAAKYPVFFPETLRVTLIRQAEVMCTQTACSVVFVSIVGKP
jgi:tetratricopeptide (TPR) repeat protein